MAAKKKTPVTTRKKQIVHLTLDTDSIDAQIKAFVGSRVEEILHNQMGNIVTGELAKLKLTNKNPVVVADIVQKQIASVTKAEIRAIARENRPAIYRQFRVELEKASNGLHKEMSTLQKAFAERLKAVANNIRF